jgi:hypothetical protein
MVFKSDGRLTKAKNIIESVIKDLGISPADNTIESVSGGYAWQISRGSAHVMIYLLPGANQTAARVRIVSPLVKTDGDISYEMAVDLLKRNGSRLPGISFGLISENIVVLVTERSVVNLDKSGAMELLNLAGYYADKYDDLLVKEFGGTRVCDLS